MRKNLTKKDLINSVYMRIGFSKKITENLLEDFFDIIILSLREQNQIKIAKFGTFTIRNKKSRIGRNPATKEKKTIWKNKKL